MNMAFETSNTPLAANGTFIIGPNETFRAQNITGSVFADQSGTLYVEQSFDGQNWDISNSISVSASAGQGFSEPVLGTYFRLRYVNGGTNQGAFRLFGRAFQLGAT